MSRKRAGLTLGDHDQPLRVIPALASPGTSEEGWQCPTLTQVLYLSPCQHQEECRPVKHVLFSAWPDHQTPESAGPLLRLMTEVDESPEAAASAGPIVVHCRYDAPPSTQP